MTPLANARSRRDYFSRMLAALRLAVAHDPLLQKARAPDIAELEDVVQRWDNEVQMLERHKEEK